jgi:hypothetical protein
MYRNFFALLVCAAALGCAPSMIYERSLRAPRRCGLSLRRKEGSSESTLWHDFAALSLAALISR